MKDFKKFDKNIDKSVYETLDLKNSINNKKSYGGTAISEIRKMISLARNELKNEKYQYYNYMFMYYWVWEKGLSRVYTI